jgi:integral membrane protein
MNAHWLPTVRTIAQLEGVSFLLLLLVAMPLKYIVHIGIGVRIVGAVHGVLFLAFAFTLIRISLERKWRWQLVLKMFVLSLVPFGFIAMARHLRSAPHHG